MKKSTLLAAFLIISLGSIFAFTARSQINATINPLEDDVNKPKAVLRKFFNQKPFKKKPGIEWSHAPYNTRRCGWCHQSNSRKNPGAMKAPVNSICLNCHTYMEIKPNSHEPVQKDCGYCHNAHNSPNAMLLHRPIQILCVTCHLDKGTQMQSAVSHGALLDAASCENCHRSHWSTHKKLVNVSQTELCIRCHGGDGKTLRDNKRRVLDNIAKRLNRKVKHAPFAKGDCSECHDFHGSQYPRLLGYRFPSEFYTPYTDSKYGLCYRCHQKKRITTPRTQSVTGFRNGDVNLHYVHVVEPTEGRSCRACHNSHATNSKNLIRSSVPFGSTAWQLTITYTETKTGGRCSKTCHDEKTYVNDGLRPTDVARAYNNRVETSTSE